MVMYANEFKTKENQKLAEIQKLTATYILRQLLFSISVNSGFRNIYLATSWLGKHLASIHLDFK